MTRPSVAKTRPLRDVFGGEPEEFHAGVARLCVLYTDLHLELTEAAPPSSPNARRNYFIRRSFGTLREFGEELAMLDGGGPFKRIVGASLSPGERGQWNSAIAWFGEHAETIQNLRNDFGGHFSHDAALDAVRNIDEAGDGTLEIRHEGLGAGPYLHFADAIVDLVYFKRRGEVDTPTYAKNVFTSAKTGYQHAAKCVHLLVVYFLAPRFGFTVKPPSS